MNDNKTGAKSIAETLAAKRNKGESRLREEAELEARFGRKGGMRVPEGYFARMAEEVVSRLPDEPVVERHVEMTRWQRLKPYVYLAAMFCGIWLMMQVFHTVSGNGRVSLDNPPERIAQLMDAPEVHDVYTMMPELMNDTELEEEVADSYDDIRELKADFREAGLEIDSEESASEE